MPVSRVGVSEALLRDKHLENSFILYVVLSPFSLSATNIALVLIILFGLVAVYKSKDSMKPELNIVLVASYTLLFSWTAFTAVASKGFISKTDISKLWEYSSVILLPYFLSVIEIRKDRVVYILLLLSSIVSFLGILQYFIPSIKYPFPRQLVREDFRGFFSHHLHTGGFYSIITILSLSLSLFWQCDREKKLLSILFFLLNLSALILSMARCYYLSVFAVILALLFVKGRRCFYSGVVIILAISALTFSFPNAVARRAKSILDIDYPSNKERIYIWKAAIEMAKDHPLMGVGVGNWRRESVKNYFPKFEKEWDYTSPAKIHAHNTYLAWLTETGFIGLSLFLFFWVATARLLLLKACEIPKACFDYPLIVGSFAALCNLFIAGMFEHNFGTSVVLLLITFLIGLSLSQNKISNKEAIEIWENRV